MIWNLQHYAKYIHLHIFTLIINEFVSVLEWGRTGPISADFCCPEGKSWHQTKDKIFMWSYNNIWEAVVDEDYCPSWKDGELRRKLQCNLAHSDPVRLKFSDNWTLVLYLLFRDCLPNSNSCLLYVQVTTT